MLKSEALRFRTHLNSIIESLEDETALTVIDLFPLWKTNKAYALNDRVQYSGVLYKCVQAHTSQDNWTPDQTPALWTSVSVEDWPEWVQPTGAQDAYNTGDQVSHSDKHWISTVDANVWEPGVYGWDEVTE